MSEIQALRDRIEQLEGVLGVDRSTAGRIRDALGVEPLHAQILGMLISRDFVTRDGLYTVLYQGRPECEWPEDKILDVQICKLRAHLKRRDIDLPIQTKWGEGWSMTREAKAWLRAIIAGHDKAAAPIAARTG
jgi:DNA-binding response OmpR family regulator